MYINLLISIWYPNAQIYHNFLHILLLMDIQFGAMMNNAAVNIFVHIFLYTCVHISESKIASHSIYKCSTLVGNVKSFPF